MTSLEDSSAKTVKGGKATWDKACGVTIETAAHPCGGTNLCSGDTCGGNTCDAFCQSALHACYTEKLDTPCCGWHNTQNTGCTYTQ